MTTRSYITYMESEVFRTWLDEVAEEATKVIRARETLLQADPESDAYSDAIADLSVALTLLQSKVPLLLEEEERVFDQLPDDDDDDEA